MPEAEEIFYFSVSKILQNILKDKITDFEKTLDNILLIFGVFAVNSKKLKDRKHQIVKYLKSQMYDLDEGYTFLNIVLITEHIKLTCIEDEEL